MESSSSASSKDELDNIKQIAPNSLALRQISELNYLFENKLPSGL